MSALIRSDSNLAIAQFGLDVVYEQQVDSVLVTVLQTPSEITTSVFNLKHDFTFGYGSFDTTLSVRLITEAETFVLPAFGRITSLRFDTDHWSLAELRSINMK